MNYPALFTLLILSIISSSSFAEKTKIGVSLPLSGPAATYGTDIRNILEFSNSKLGDKYQLIFEDDKCSAREAVNIANKFSSEMKLKFVTGYACSPAILAAAPVYERNKVLAIGLIATSKNVTSAGDYIFRTYQSNETTSNLLAQYVFEQHKQLAVLSEEDEYAQSFLAGIKKEAESRQTTVENLDFRNNESDIRSLLLKLKSKNLPALFINIRSESALINVLKQFRQLNWKVPVYNAFFASSPTILKNNPDLAEDVVLIDSPWPEIKNCSKCSLIYQEFQSKYTGMQSVESIFISAYEGFKALDSAISAEKQGVDAKNFLYNTEFDGITGKWSFDKNGDVQNFRFVIKVIKDGKAEIIHEF